MRLPTIFKAKYVIISINGIIQREDIETISQQRTEGNWTIVTRTAEAANKLILANAVIIRPEKEQYKIHARLPRSINGIISINVYIIICIYKFIISINGIIQREDIETISQQRTVEYILCIKRKVEKKLSIY